MQRKCALLSTHDKTGIIEFATQLSECGFDILSTGGTARTLKAAGIQVIDVEQFTGDKEILGGRVKTLHPRIHAGLLYDEQLHREGLPAGYRTIDLVAVTLYPFAQAVAQNLDEARREKTEQAADHRRGNAAQRGPRHHPTQKSGAEKMIASFLRLFFAKNFSHHPKHGR
ncbi:MAG: hypothetical protein EB121_05185 [Alphaproteobacteria bacterium]|nr:hypothetical protein [Alphaproteobacteria bacterium]